MTEASVMSSPVSEATPLGVRTTRIFTYPYTNHDFHRIVGELEHEDHNAEIAARWILDDQSRITITTTTPNKEAA